jgi:hypothetical protein
MKNPLFNQYRAKEIGRLIEAYEKKKADFLLAAYRLYETGYYDVNQDLPNIPQQFEDAIKTLESEDENDALV